MTALLIIIGIVAYLVFCYAYESRNYKRGCGLSALAFLLAPVLLPLSAWSSVKKSFRRFG